MIELSTSTIATVAVSKIIFIIYALTILLFIWIKARPIQYVLVSAMALSLFYIVLSRQAQTLWWGNIGDENLILAYLTQTVHGNAFSDFYYSWLPPFYPPLYFWLTGWISRFFVSTTVGAAKLGVTMMLAAWFIIPYVVCAMYKKYISQDIASQHVSSSRWLWFLAPLVLLMTLDFDSLITKPYEVLPALLTAIVIGLLAESLQQKQWTTRYLVFYGLIGGILFLTFYFWWFLAIPSAFLLALFTTGRIKNIMRILIISIIIFFVALPYLGPLLASYSQYGIENWQAYYFVPQDFYTFVPWTNITLAMPLLLAGLIGLIWGSAHSPFIRGVFVLFFMTYMYQFFNIVRFLTGSIPLQSSKPFLFLGSACLALGTAYIVLVLYKRFISQWSAIQQKIVFVIVFVIALPLLPYIRFIDDPVVLAQIEKNYQEPTSKMLAQAIQTNVPDYRHRMWLASSPPDLSPYIPMTYFISYNLHFSHPAVLYSTRYAAIEALSKTQTADAFMAIIAQGMPKPIDAMVLFTDSERDEYVLFFWRDNYPNGGVASTVSIPTKLISDEYWHTVYNDGEWIIVVRK